MATIAQPASASEASARWLVPTLTLATFAVMTSAFGLGPFLPVIARELDTSVALVGQIPASMMLLAALLGLVIGPIADYVGYRRVLVIGLLTVVASTLATGFASNYPLLLLAALVGAGGRAAVLPVAQSLVATRFQENAARRRALSWLNMGVSCSLILGLPLLTTIASLTHWRLAFVLLGGAALGMSFLLTRLLPRDAAPPSTRPGARCILAGYGPILRDRSMLCLLGGTLFGVAGQFVILTYLAVFLDERHALDTREVGWVYLVVGLGGLLGNWLAGGRLGADPRSTMIATRLLGGSAVAAALILPMSALAAVGLLWMSMVLFTPSVVATALMLASESSVGRATRLALNFAAAGLGQGLGGAVGGPALILGGWAAVGLCSFGLLLAGAWLAWQSRPVETLVPALAAP
jgi:MFS transporter, DHA1 family, inner membrane transport protein